jgi:hypothetical protein
MRDSVEFDCKGCGTRVHLITGQHADPDCVEVCLDCFLRAAPYREKLVAMHRRAQRLEGIEQRFETVKENMIGWANTLGSLERVKTRFWRALYRSAVNQLRAAGVREGEHTGILTELIARLVAERDEARAERETLRLQVLNLNKAIDLL